MSSSDKRVSKKKSVGVPDTNFNVNWEVQAEQLKYTIKKEVEEAKLIEEALKSLQRSFKNEEEKRKRAEIQRNELMKQIEDLELIAKKLKEQIREKRIQRKGTAAVEESDSDSEPELEVSGHNQGQLLINVPEEEEFENILNEVRGEASLPSQNMTIGQRMQLIKDFSSDQQKQQKQKEKYIKEHKIIIKDWMRRENSAHRTKVDDHSKNYEESAKLRDELLSEFIKTENELLDSINTIIRGYLKEFLRARILSPEHLSIVFSNIAAFLSLQNQLLDAAEGIANGEKDYCCLGRVLNYNSDNYLQFIGSRKESTDLLSMAETKSRFIEFLNSANITTAKLNQLMNSVVSRISEYPNWIITILPHVNDREYAELSFALSKLTKILENTRFAPVKIPNRAEIFAIQYSFDWRDKDASFINNKRVLLARAEIKRRKKDKSTEDVHFYLFSDVIVVSRNYGWKQIFKCFIPLEHVLVWDVPARSHVEDFIFEIVDMRTSKKMEFLCTTPLDQSKLVEAISIATLKIDIVLDI